MQVTRRMLNVFPDARRDARFELELRSMSGVTKYFEGVAGYSAPMQPRNPISEEDAKRRRVYYRVVFDDAERIVQVTKFLDSRFELQFDYQYDIAGQVSSAQVTGPDGKSQPIDVPRAVGSHDRLRA